MQCVCTLSISHTKHSKTQEVWRFSSGILCFKNKKTALFQRHKRQPSIPSLRLWTFTSRTSREKIFVRKNGGSRVWLLPYEWFAQRWRHYWEFMRNPIPHWPSNAHKNYWKLSAGKSWKSKWMANLPNMTIFAAVQPLKLFVCNSQMINESTTAPSGLRCFCTFIQRFEKEEKCSFCSFSPTRPLIPTTSVSLTCFFDNSSKNNNSKVPHNRSYRLFESIFSSRLYLFERFCSACSIQEKSLACSFGIHLMRQKFSAERISLEKMILLSGYDFVEVRRYAWELWKQAFTDSEKTLPKRFDSSRSNGKTHDTAFNICREHLLDSWDIENIIRVCDSVRDDVRNFGLEQLRIFVLGADHEQQSWSNGDQDTLTELARRLSQHPSIEVEAFLMKLFKNTKKKLSHLHYSITLINSLSSPCFKRIFSRVNGQTRKRQTMDTRRDQSVGRSSQSAELYPLLSWLSGTHLKKTSSKRLRLCYPYSLSFQTCRSHKISITSLSPRPLLPK